MRLLATILTATAICAGMMACAIDRAGDPPRSEPSTGLTAAIILGTDGMAPDGLERSNSRLDRVGLVGLVTGALRADHDGAQ